MTLGNKIGAVPTLQTKKFGLRGSFPRAFADGDSKSDIPRLTSAEVNSTAN